MSKKTLILFLSATAFMGLVSCNRLSKQAKEMVGNYYIPEISEDEPLMELRKDGKCTIRAINPGVLTISVDGRWNVLDDSLKIDLKPETIITQGDSTLVGNIPQHIGKSIVEFNGISLTVNDGGITYVYHRRPI